MDDHDKDDDHDEDNYLMGECSYGDPLPRPRDEGGGAGGHVRVVDRTSGHVTQKESLKSLISFAFPSVHLISD